LVPGSSFKPFALIAALEQGIDADALFGVEILHTRSLRPNSRLSYATRPFPDRREETEAPVDCNAWDRGNLRTLAHEEELPRPEGVAPWHGLLDLIEHLPGGVREDTL
jgi:hypothetical protein